MNFLPVLSSIPCQNLLDSCVTFEENTWKICTKDGPKQCCGHAWRELVAPAGGRGETAGPEAPREAPEGPRLPASCTAGCSLLAQTRADTAETGSHFEIFSHNIWQPIWLKRSLSLAIRSLSTRRRSCIIVSEIQRFASMALSEAVLKIAQDSAAAHKRIASHLLQTMCLPSRTTTGLFFKTENFQYTGSFKLRGALSKMTILPRDTPVITASSGNHGIACSHAAKTTGHSLTVVLPETVAKAKLEKIQSYGTKTILHPGDAGLAEQYAQALAKKGDCVYVSPYNDSAVIAGQGTLGIEVAEQLPEIDNIFVSMGGGGLISGIGSTLKAAAPHAKVFGVSAQNSAAFAASIRAGRVVETGHLLTLADGCAGAVDADAITLPIASEIVDGLIDCSEDQIAEALRLLAWNEHVIVEGSAGLAYAGYLAHASNFKDQNNVVLLCGGNFDKATIQSVLM